jgi:hypothetical protein
LASAKPALVTVPRGIPEGMSWKCLVGLMMRRQKILGQPEIVRAVRRGNKSIYWVRGRRGNIWPIVVAF